MLFDEIEPFEEDLFDWDVLDGYHAVPEEQPAPPPSIPWALVFELGDMAPLLVTRRLTQAVSSIYADYPDIMLAMTEALDTLCASQFLINQSHTHTHTSRADVLVSAARRQQGLRLRSIMLAPFMSLYDTLPQVLPEAVTIIQNRVSACVPFRLPHNLGVTQCDFLRTDAITDELRLSVPESLRAHTLPHENVQCLLMRPHERDLRDTALPSSWIDRTRITSSREQLAYNSFSPAAAGVITAVFARLPPLPLPAQTVREVAQALRHARKECRGSMFVRKRPLCYEHNRSLACLSLFLLMDKVRADPSKRAVALLLFLRVLSGTSEEPMEYESASLLDALVGEKRRKVDTVVTSGRSLEQSVIKL